MPVPLDHPALQPSEQSHVHKQAQPLSVDTGALRDGAVTTPKIADNAVTTPKIADGSVTSAKILDGTISSGDLAADSVIAGKIATGAIDQSTDFAAGVVNSTALASSAVTTGKIASAAIDALGLFSTNLYNINVTRAVPSAARNTTSATYVDWPVTEPISISYTKAITNSRLLVVFGGTCFGTVANALAQFAIRVDSGSDTEISRWFGNTLNSHLTVFGIAEITGISSGARTIKLRAHTDGVMTLNVDASDFNVVAVAELP